ncbi:MAG: fumarylacetoacetate hydrolase family protein [Halanaeroarchaeum sp.]
MRIARAWTDDDIVRGEYDDGSVHTDEGTYDVCDGDAELLAPAEPSALYCVGRNYGAKVDQMDYDVPDDPDFFIKPPTSVLAPEADIPYPAWTDELTYAGELAAVIGERAHDVAPEAVPDVVEGYTILNDVDALDQHRRTARKAFDGSGPLGPWIETDVDPYGLAMHTDIDGERRQEANTDQMLFDPYETVAFLSERFTFRPGDVISFGSPANPGLIEPGTTVEITYEGVGTLRNGVAAPE